MATCCIGESSFTKRLFKCLSSHVKTSPRAPSDPASIKISLSSSASTIAHPAPSPNNTQVLRSLQSRILESVSTPMIIIFLPIPALAYATAVFNPKTNPEHAALISIQTALTAPIPFCT